MKIRARKYPNGKTRWQLDLGIIDGKRSQRLYDTREEALGALRSAKAKRATLGTAGLSLSDADRLRYIVADRRLAAAGLTIEDAVTIALRDRPALREPLALALLLDRAIDHKRTLAKSTRYLQQFRCSCLAFIRGREMTPAHEITAEDVRAWVLGNAWAPKTQRVYLGDLRALFSFAGSIGAASLNPCAAIPLAAMPDAPIATLAVDQVKKLFTVACRAPESEADEGFRELLYYLTLATFCGIRPAELARMDRAQVSRTERHAVVEGSQAKTRRRRVVDIAPNAARWLALDPLTAGPVTPPNFRRRWARLRAAAGWRPEKQALVPDDPPPDPALPVWPHDVLRHTFASFHYAAHQNESLLKAQLGHSSREEVLFRHYRATKTRAEAAAFWSLAP